MSAGIFDSLQTALARGIVYGMADFFRGFDFVLINGGWLLLALFLGYLLFFNRWLSKLIANMAGWKIITLNINVPSMPNPSIMAAESIFAYIHNWRPLSWRDRWLKGTVIPWYDFEIVSLGGTVRYLIRCVDSSVEHVKAAVFSQYPDAEITEVGDYMEAIPITFDPDASDFDFWGTEMMLNQNEAVPIRTYPTFEHRAAEVIIDPLAPLLEFFSSINSDEIMAMQILIQGENDAWKEGAKSEIEKKKGTDEAMKKTEGRELNYLRFASQQERDLITDMQNKINKISYNSKIRVIYIAPKDKLNRAKTAGIMNAFKVFSGSGPNSHNSFRPNTFAWTQAASKYSDVLEAGRVKRLTLWHKREFLRNYKRRSLYQGGKIIHFSIEELATMFHFPLETVRKATVEHVEARKGEPPANIPI